jgi:endonuclease/exonuclease/phosphatase family metal-dependent hydrolase
VTLSILTLNLWHDAGPYAERVGRIREWIDRLDPDLIAFQEALRARGRDQVAELLAHRPYHLAYVSAARMKRSGTELDDADFGNAVASRWPITDRFELRLPDGGDGETRAALSVTVDAPFGLVGVTCTHLNWKFRHGVVREKQVVAVCELALRRRPRSGFPPLLVGDFNAEPDSAEIRYVTGLQSLGGRSVSFLDAWRMGGDGGPGFTWSNGNDYARPALEPDRRIDYVFAGFPRRDGVGRVECCRVVCDDARDGVWPTDHFGVYAELRTEALQGAEAEWGLAGGDDVHDV